MKTIKIKKLSLHYFKGCIEKTINFADITVIEGQNKSGKTTLFDAFTWLLFGKDSSGKSDFNIKTLDLNNTPISKIEHTVIGVLEVDRQDTELKKIFKEKWTKKRGSEIAEMVGHTTEYFINDVPFQEGQYKEKISEIIDEQLFKLITNSSYFNQMKWEDRRVILSDLAGGITDQQIAEGNEEFLMLLEQLSGKTIEEYKREIAKKKLKLKEDIEAIPLRIDEAVRSMPEAYDYGDLEAEKEMLRAKHAELENTRNSLLRKHNESNAKIKDVLDAKLKLETELQELKNNNIFKNNNRLAPIRSELKQAKDSLAIIENNIQSSQTRKYSIISRIEDEKKAYNEKVEGKRKQIQANENLIATYQKENDRDRELFGKEAAKEFILNDFPTECQTCKQRLPDDKIEGYKKTAQLNFSEAQQKTLAEIRARGINRANSIETLKSINQNFEKEISIPLVSNNVDAQAIQLIDGEISKYNQEVENKKIEIQSIENKLLEAQSIPAPVDPMEIELQKTIDSIVVAQQPTFDDSTTIERNAINEQISAINTKLDTGDQIAKINIRIDELNDEQREYSQQLANLERVEFVMAEFNRAKAQVIENNINGKFKLVKFRMFKTQVNGAQEECCDTLVDGVPYPDVNTADKINAGIDIINALCKHHNISAPIWVDNCESVNDVMETTSQIIKLYVTKTELKIN